MAAIRREARVPVPDPPAWWIVALALAAALLVQSTVGSALVVRGATISWTLLVVVWYALRTGSLGGLVVGLIAGACEDALATATSPAWTIATGVAGFIAGRAARTAVSDSRAWLVPLVALLAVARYAVFATALHVTGRPIVLPLAHVHAALWQSALDALAALALVLAFPRLRGERVARG